MDAMPLYEFVSAEGAQGKFPTANKAIRSHAMRTALQTRSQRPPGGGLQAASSADSEDIVKRKDELKGRFRLPNKTKKKNSPAARKDGEGPGLNTQIDEV